MKDYRNKPNKHRDKQRTRKQRHTDVRDIPKHVWDSIKTPKEREVDFYNRYNGKLYDTYKG